MPNFSKAQNVAVPSMIHMSLAKQPVSVARSSTSTPGMISTGSVHTKVMRPRHSPST